MTMFAVYKVRANGALQYLPRSVTHSEKLAREIAAERSRGEITMPDGSIRYVRAAPHVSKPLNEVLP